MARGSTRAAQQRKYHERQVASGMTRLSVWVPRQHRDDFWRVVSHLQANWAAARATAQEEDQ